MSILLRVEARRDARLLTEAGGMASRGRANEDEPKDRSLSNISGYDDAVPTGGLEDSQRS